MEKAVMEVAADVVALYQNPVPLKQQMDAADGCSGGCGGGCGGG